MSNEQQIYSDQAYLLWALLQDDSFLKKNSQREFVKEIEGSYEPQNVPSRISAKKNSKKPGQKEANKLFFTLENHKLSALVPELRLFRVDSDGNKPFYFPINTKFDTLEGIPPSERLLGGGDFTSNANGIQSFSVKYQGTDLYTSDKYLECEMSLYVESLRNIFREPPAGFARLADLFALRVTGKEATRQGISSGQTPRSIEIAATLGYSILNRDIFTDEEITAITETFQIIRMNVSDHTIDLKQDGTATISISYTARMEALGGSTGNSSFFSVTSEPVDIVDIAELMVFTEGAKNINAPKQENAKGKKPVKKLIRKNSKSMQIRQVFFIAESLDGFGELAQTPDLVKKYKQFVDPTIPLPGTSLGQASPGSLAPSPPFSTTGTTRDFIEAAKAEVDKFHERKDPISFLYFGDLIEAFFIKTNTSMLQASILINEDKEKSPEEKEQIRKEISKRTKQLEKFKVLLPNVKLTFQNNTKTINLASLPLAMPTVTSYLYKSFFDNANIMKFTISDFLKSLQLLLAQMFEHPTVSILLDGDHKFEHLNYSGPRWRVRSKKKIKINDTPGPNTSMSPRDDEEYYLIYQTNDIKGSSPALTGVRSTDEDKGVYHFVPGQDRGLTKNISFTKFEVPYKREQLMVEQTSMYDELMMPYSANISMFGNNLFLPGSQIYIDPYSIGFGDPSDKNSSAVRLGFGGYYRVLSVSTTFTPGQLETTLDCSFGSFPASVITAKASRITTVTENSGVDKTLPFDNAKSADSGQTRAPEPVAEAAVPPEDLYEGDLDATPAFRGTSGEFENV